MPKHIWSIPCQLVITDQETNTTSYITCLEGFTFPELPFPFPPIFVGTLWHKTSEDDEIEIRIRVVSPTGDVLHTRAHPRKRFEQYQRYRINLRLGGFDISEAGEYTLLVEHKEDEEWMTDASLPVVISAHSGEQEEESD